MMRGAGPRPLFNQRPMRGQGGGQRGGNRGMSSGYPSPLPPASRYDPYSRYAPSAPSLPPMKSSYPVSYPLESPAADRRRFESSLDYYETYRAPVSYPIQRKPTVPGNRVPGYPVGPSKPDFYISDQCMNDITQALLQDRMRQKIVPTGYGARGGPRFPVSLERPRIMPGQNSGFRPQRLPPRKPPAAVKNKPGPPLKAKTQVKKKKPKKKPNKNYKVILEQQLLRPWVNDALKVELAKKFEMLEDAKSKNTDEAWKEYQAQKEKCDKINDVLRTEYIGAHPEADINKIMKETARMAKLAAQKAKMENVQDAPSDAAAGDAESAGAFQAATDGSTSVAI